MSLSARRADAPVDLGLAWATILLLACGLLLIYSTSYVLAMSRMNDPYHYIKKQLMFVGMGLGVGLYLMKTPSETLRRYSGPALALVLGMLALVLIPGIGKVAGGARRWLGAGPLRFQPSELAKIALVLFVANRLSHPGEGAKLWLRGKQGAMLAIAAAAGLTLLEPDFGSAVMLTLIGVSLLYVSGINLKTLWISALALLPLAAFFIIRSPYRMRRVTTFFDPWADPNGAGFQIVHSMMAFGSGGVSGEGLGQGKQKLFYLPEPHTDFIFATAGEEFGLVGCLTLLAIMMVFLWRGLAIALRNQDEFKKYAALGLSVYLGLQMVVNLFVVLGLAPTKGSTMPFLSSGGSSLVVNLMAVGLLLNFSRRSEGARE